MPTVSRSVILAVAMAVALATPGLARLAYRTDDVYVRQSDLIIVGDAVAVGMRGQVPVAEVEAVEVIMGPPPRSSVYVRHFPDGREDMPRFRMGDRSLLFLGVDPAAPGVFWCVGAQATKRDFRSEDIELWATMLDRVTQLASVRIEPDEQVRTEALVGLLDSQDLDLVAAASNYLNYLLTGQEDEGWVINPPKDSSDWSWRDYFRRNAVAHREGWQAWWRAQQAKP